MADRKITDLTALTTQASGDVLPIVDVSEAAAADKNKKITVSNLFQGIPVPVLVNQASVLSDVSSPQIETTGDIVINSSTTGSGQTASLNLYHLVSNNAATRPGGRISSVAEGTYTAGSAATSDSALTFSTTSNATLSERVRIDSSGRLLCGTTSARTTLFNTTTYGSQFCVEQTGVAAASYAQASFVRNSNDAEPASIVLGKSRGTTTNAVTVVQSGDNLGLINFEGGDGTNLVDAASIACAVDGAPGGNDMPGRLVFSTTADGASSPTERMRIGQNGLSYFFSSGSPVIYAGSSSSAGTTNAIFQGGHSATSTLTGTTSYVVFTNGNVVNTNNSYGSLSDVKLKENIADATSQWSDIKALQVRKYNFKEGQTHTQIGLIAQEVELVSPGLVSESPDRDEDGNDLGTTTKSVNYSVLYMKAVKALQEAMERIETLEAKVTALESA